MLGYVLSPYAFVAALIIFGFAPGAALRLIVLAFPRDDPRRRELLAELHAVKRVERPFWVVEQLEVAIFEGLWGRVVGIRSRRGRWHLEPGLDLPPGLRWEEFVHRMTGPDGVDLRPNGTWTCSSDPERPLARAILADMGVDVERSLEFFAEHGGFCDCEILLNIAGQDDLNDQLRRRALG